MPGDEIYFGARYNFDQKRVNYVDLACVSFDWNCHLDDYSGQSS